MSTITPRQRHATRTAAYSLAALLAGSGTLHFLAPKPFDAMVPAELPGSQRFYTYASGVAEIGIATALVPPRTRRFGGLAAAALFVAVLPANVNLVRLWRHQPWPKPAAALARLPLQIPLITTALRVWRNG